MTAVPRAPSLAVSISVKGRGAIRYGAMRTIPVIALLCTLVGCAARQTYQVSVANRSGEPITFGLVKQGDPFERQWMSPEFAARVNEKPNAAMWAALPPGKTAHTEPVRGRFYKGAEAYLRIYQGDLKLVDILAISRGQPNRLDIPLHPGLNRFVVSDKEGEFTAVRDEPTPRSPVQQ